MYEIICIINKACGIILLFGDGSLYHDAIRDATKKRLTAITKNQKIESLSSLRISVKSVK